jgi:peptidoglycan/xylan/chitin deacetylase (PgdA/CDA1 family)
MGKEGKYLGLALALALLLPWAGLALQERAGEAVPVSAPAESVQAEPPLVALTFDDGPRRSTTTQLLDGLAQRGVKATFFLIGEQIPGSEDLVERMEEEGHQVGIHTYDHVRLTALNDADFAAQVDRTRALLKDLVGREDFPLRPPYGAVDAGVESRAGAPLILWSVDPEDWKDKNTDRIVSHVVQNAKDGDVILLHDIYATSVEAALQIVDALHQKGFLFVTVDELARQRHVELTAGTVYRCFYP